MNLKNPKNNNSELYKKHTVVEVSVGTTRGLGSTLWPSGLRQRK